MNPDVQNFLDKFSQDAEELIRNVAAFNQLAHLQNHSYKQSTHPCHQKFPQRPETPSAPRPRQIPPKVIEKKESSHGTQTCQCLFKHMKSTNTEKGRSSTINEEDFQNDRRSTVQSNRNSRIQKRPSSMQAEKRCFTEAMPLKSFSASNKKRGCCGSMDDSCDDNSSITSQHKCDKCVCKSNRGAPVDIQNTNMEFEEFSEKFSDAQRSLQILRSRIADMNYYVNEGEAKMKMKQRSPKICPPCPPPPSFASGAGYGTPELPRNPLPDLPPIRIKKLISRKQYQAQGGVENNFSFGNMPALPPHAVPVLPGTFVSLGKTLCTPRNSKRSSQRVSFHN